MAAVEEEAGALSEDGSEGVSRDWLAKAIAAMRRTTTPTTVTRPREARGCGGGAVGVGGGVREAGTGLARAADLAVSAAAVLVVVAHSVSAPSASYDGSARSRVDAVW
ncbi:hypothetical protein GCM10020254_46270 [Streptomyces goshikiensis]